MASLVEMAGTSLYGDYTQGTFGVNPSPDFETWIGYSNPAVGFGYDDQVDNPQGSGVWGVGNNNFAFGNVKARSPNNRKSLHNAGASGVSNYGPNNTSPGIGTGNYMDPFASTGTSFAAILADQPWALTPDAPGSYTDRRGATGPTPPF